MVILKKLCAVFLPLALGCGTAEDLVKVRFVNPKAPLFLDLSEHEFLPDLAGAFTGVCSVGGPEARAIIKGPGIPGGENVIDIPGGLSVDSSVFATASTTVSLPEFSIFVPKGDQRVIAISLLVEHNSGDCNSVNNDKRHLVAGFVGPVSIQSSVNLPISLKTTIVPITVKIGSTNPSSITSALAPVRVAELNGISCGGITATAKMRDSVHSGVGYFPLNNPGGYGSRIYVYPVAPNREYLLRDICNTGDLIQFTTAGLAGSGAVQSFNCSGTTAFSCIYAP
jgi:hypothetical protein